MKSTAILLSSLTSLLTITGVFLLVRTQHDTEARSARARAPAVDVHPRGASDVVMPEELVESAAARLGAPVVVWGRAFDPRGFPVAEAAVSLFVDDADFTRVANTRTDSDGLFEFPPVDGDRDYVVAARVRSRSPVRQKVVPGSPNEFALERADEPAGIVVRVVDDFGAPVPDFVLDMSTDEKPQRVLFRDRTVRDRGGVFQGLVHLPPGRATDCVARVAAGGHASSDSLAVSVQPGDAAVEFLVTLRRAPIIEGHVIGERSRRPVGGALVQPFDAKGRPLPATRSNDAGTFRLVEGQGLDMARLMVDAAGFAPSRLSTVELASQRDLLVELSDGAVLAGDVYSEAGLPWGGALVSTWTPEDSEGPMIAPPAWFKTVASDAGGQFRLPPAPVGRVRVGLLARSEGAPFSQSLSLVQTIRVQPAAEYELLLDASVAELVHGRVELPEFFRGVSICVDVRREHGDPDARLLASWLGTEGQDFEMRVGEVGPAEALELRVHINQDHCVLRTLEPGRRDVGLLRFDDEAMREFFQDS